MSAERRRRQTIPPVKLTGRIVFSRADTAAVPDYWRRPAAQLRRLTPHPTYWRLHRNLKQATLVTGRPRALAEALYFSVQESVARPSDGRFADASIPSRPKRARRSCAYKAYRGDSRPRGISASGWLIVLAQERLSIRAAEESKRVVVRVPAEVGDRRPHGDAGGLQQAFQLRCLPLRVRGCPAEPNEQSRRGAEEDASQRASGNPTKADAGRRVARHVLQALRAVGHVPGARLLEEKERAIAPNMLGGVVAVSRLEAAGTLRRPSEIPLAGDVVGRSSGKPQSPGAVAGAGANVCGARGAPAGARAG